MQRVSFSKDIKFNKFDTAQGSTLHSLTLRCASQRRVTDKFLILNLKKQHLTLDLSYSVVRFLNSFFILSTEKILKYPLYISSLPLRSLHYIFHFILEEKSQERSWEGKENSLKNRNYSRKNSLTNKYDILSKNSRKIWIWEKKSQKEHGSFLSFIIISSKQYTVHCVHIYYLRQIFWKVKSLDTIKFFQ